MPSLKSCRLGLGSFETRITPAVFDIGNGDIAGFVSAVTTSSTNNEADTINLAFNGTYDFQSVSGTTLSALPVFDFDTNEANTVTINGNNATLNRTVTEEFRFLFVQGTDKGRATLNVNEVNFNGGKVTGGRFGGAASIRSAFANFTDCTFTGNSANDGGAIIGAVDTTIGGITLTRCMFSQNTADGAAGQGSGRGGAIVIAGGTTISIDDCTFTSNTALQSGAGVYVLGTPLTISDSSFTNNSATAADSSGGGITSQKALTITNSDITGNTAASSAGVYVVDSCTIRNSSITGNIATDAKGVGGGIDCFTKSGSFILENSTVDGNVASSGGGIQLYAVTASILNSTITSNNASGATGSGGGINVMAGTGSIQLANSIIATNTATGGGVGPDIVGTFNSFGYNLVGITDGGTLAGSFLDLTGTATNPLDPLLDVLTNSGSTTYYRPPLPGSPIVDAGDPIYSGGASFDQRGPGFPRVLFGRLDIGSIEVPQVDVRITMTDNVTSVIPGDQVTYTITVSNVGFETVTDARVRVTLPAELTNADWIATLSNGASGNTQGAGDINELVTLDPGATIDYVLTATVRPSALGFLETTAIILPPIGAADPNDDNTALDTDLLTPQADAFVTISSTGRPNPNSTITYTIQVGNFGLSTASNFQLTDVLPTQIVSAKYTSSASSGAFGNTQFGTGNINDLLFIDPNSTVIYTVQAVIGSDVVPGDMVNTITLTPPVDFDEPSLNNNADSDIVLIKVGDTSIVIGTEAGQSPVVRIIDPTNGVLRRAFFAYNPAFRGGVRVATADFNGDNTLDIVTAAGAGGGPHVRIFNGLNGLLMGEYFAYGGGFSGGVYVATGDFNGDGTPDVITGAGAGGGPHVRVFSGVTSQLLTQFFAYTPSFTGGVRVASGDVNRDGMDDIITGAGPGGGPHVIAFDAASLQKLRSFFAYSSAFRGGVYVSSGDFNNDDYDDIVTAPGEGGGPHIRIISGLTGAAIRDFQAFAANGNPTWSSGARVAVSADINGDGIPELVVAPGRGRSGLVRHLDGASLNVIREFPASDPSFLGGVFVGGG